MDSTWGDLDQTIGRLLASRGVVAAHDLPGLYTYGREQRLVTHGSILLGAALARGLVTPVGAQGIIALLRGGPGNTRADGSTSFESTPDGEPTFGGTPTGFGAAPSGSGTFGLAPSGTGTFGVAPGAPASGGHTRADPTFASQSPGHTTDGGSMHLPPAAASPPARRYTVVRQVSPDEVEAIDVRIGRPVVLRLAPAAGDEEKTQRYLRHAKLLGQLDHPSILQVHDIGTYQGRTFYSVDPLDGHSLLERHAQSPQVLLRAFVKLTGAIEHANSRGLIHTALQPGVVVLGTFGRVWLTGWEHARVLDSAAAGVVRAAGGVPGGLPKHALGPNSAPELRAGKTPSPATDVWGLGVILLASLGGPPLAKGRPPKIPGGLPPELAGIVRKALQSRPKDRYADAKALADDVRRFLDGKAVSVVRDSFTRATVRFVRGNPLAGGIAAAAAALFLCGGAIVFGVFRAQLATARADEARAEAAQRDALREQATAQALERSAETKQRIAEGRRQLDDRILGSSQTEASFSEAEAILTRVVAAARDAGEDTTDALEAELGARLYLARARFFLKRARPPNCRRALEDFKAATVFLLRHGADPSLLAEARFGAFLAARRLPGAIAQEEELGALQDLANLEGPLAQAARNELALRPLERRAEELSRDRGDPALVPGDAQSMALYLSLTSLTRARRDLALGHEQLGRFYQAMSGPGLIRGATVRVGAEKGPINRLRPWHSFAYQQFFHAIHLDPLDPVPRYSFMRTLNSKFGNHSFTQWKGAWAFDQLTRASMLTPRIEPTLEAVEQLEALGREASGLGFLKRVPPFEGQPRSADLPARVALSRARAQLWAGETVSESFDRLEVPDALKGEHQLLVGWRLLINGRTQRGLEMLLGGFQAIHRFLPGWRDLVQGLCDRRVDPRALESFLSRQIPPSGEHDQQPLVIAMLLARGTAFARLGRDGSRDLQRMPETGFASHNPQSWFGGKRFVAFLRSMSVREPGNPMPHVNALRLWAATNIDFHSTESLAYEFQTLVVERLRGLNARDQAAAFGGFDAVEEIWVRRYWVPAEGHAWKAGQ